MTDLTDLVRPLEWSHWGNEWDANSPFGTFTIKMDGDTGFYLFKGQDKVTDELSDDMDRSTPTDCMSQAVRVVKRRITEALDQDALRALLSEAVKAGLEMGAEECSKENHRRLALASIRVPAMSVEIEEAIRNLTTSPAVDETVEKLLKGNE